ncbi:hypothetical protein SK128_010867, partial [Halocaridina rubra]
KASQTDVRVKIVAANGNTIKTFGLKTLRTSFPRTLFLDLHSHRCKKPLLGADFLKNHRLLLDVASKQL